MNPSEAAGSKPATKLAHETTEHFRVQFADLPKRVREVARGKFNNFCRENPKHPFLRGKFVPDVYQSVRVWAIDAGNGYRALAFVVERDGGVQLYQWYWIGNSADYAGRTGGTDA